MATGHSAKTHKRIRTAQKENDVAYHHPVEKMQQLTDLLQSGVSFPYHTVLEVFAGDGNMTKYYEERGCKVEAMTKATHGNSFDSIYKLRGDRKKYGVIDIDSYGYPSKFFPVVFEMMRDECMLVITFPIVGVNCLNGITEQNFINFWRSDRPTIGDITGVMTDMALRNWFLASLIDVKKIKRIWRLVFICNRQKATEFCNVRNH